MSKTTDTDDGKLTVEEAEALTGISQQQVAKWKCRLAEPEKYRAMLFGAYPPASTRASGSEPATRAADVLLCSPASQKCAGRK